MRTAHWKAYLLPLLLLSLHSVSVCLAAICTFDEYVRNADVQHIVTAAEQPKGQNWEPLRIVTSTEDLQVPSKYCVKKNGSIGERGPQGAGSDCTVIFATVTAEQKIILNSILERAIALHTERLLVQRAVGPLVIPAFSTHPRCNIFNVPAEHRTTGVADADMVLYVASVHKLGGGDNDAALSGLMCAKSAGGRPIAGGLTFGKGYTEISRRTVRLTAHQIAHALGFSYSEMNSRNMIVYKNVRGKPNSVAAVKSEKTKEMARVHFGCSTADGMELEDGEENKEKTLSHWERRNAKDELMAAPILATRSLFMGFYTNITLAAFEDLGYYKANFQMAEHMGYGYNAGCEFLTTKCMENGVTKWPKMFCTGSKPNEGREVCTTDRLGFGFCPLRDDYSSPLPLHFQYFASPKKGGYPSYLTDYCPVVEHLYHRGCTGKPAYGNAPGSLYGKNSMCLDGSALKVRERSGIFPLGAVCAEISCEGGSVRVKYDGDKDDTWHNCPEGKTLTPSLTSDSFESGKIKCPKYKEVCTVAPDGISLVPKVVYESIKPSTSASQDPKASHKPTGEPNNSNSGEKSKDGSSVPFGYIPSVSFLMLSFAGNLIA